MLLGILQMTDMTCQCCCHGDTFTFVVIGADNDDSWGRGLNHGGKISDICCLSAPAVKSAVFGGGGAATSDLLSVQCFLLFI